MRVAAQGALSMQRNACPSMLRSAASAAAFEGGAPVAGAGMAAREARKELACDGNTAARSVTRQQPAVEPGAVRGTSANAAAAVSLSTSEM